MAEYTKELLQICDSNTNAVTTILEFIRKVGTFVVLQDTLLSVVFNRKNTTTLNEYKHCLFTLDELSTTAQNVCLMMGVEAGKSSGSNSGSKKLSIRYYDLNELTASNFDLSKVKTKTTTMKCYRLEMKGMLCFLFF